MRKIFLFFLITWQGLILFSQTQNPAGLNWKQIKTDHFQVVFPEAITSEGERTALLLENAWLPVNASLEMHTKPISVFLFNQSALSNGYTRLAPREIVFYTTPPQDADLLGNNDWIQLLSIHEYRHAVQYAKLNQGFTYFARKVFGDYGQSICMNLSIPSWVFEGDAVCTETALSQSGRGRLPSFVRNIRALELENIRYTYNEAYLGSYKVNFPDHYHLGYLMTSYIRKTYSDQTWNKVLNNTTNLSFWPFNLSRNLRKYTRNNLNHTYNNALNEYDSIWTAKAKNTKADTFLFVSVPETNVYTNYLYPFSVGTDSILVLKHGFDDISSLVLVHNFKEKNLLDINPVDRIHSNGSSVVWSTYSPDVRWGERSYSDIVKYSVKTGKKVQITKHGKYFAPALSASGEFITAIKYGSDLQCKIALLQTTSGKVINEFTLAPLHFASLPSWSDDEEDIVFIQSFNNQKTISKLHVASGEITDIIPYTNEIISSCIFWKNHVLYGTPIQGIDGIASIDMSSGKIQQVLTNIYGVYNPSLSGDTLLFEVYSTAGFRTGKINIDPSRWSARVTDATAADNYFQYLVEMENPDSLFSIKGTKNDFQPEIENYSPIKHSVFIHSWTPYTITGNGIGLKAFSNDKLNILSVQAGVEYFSADMASREYVGLSYAGLFPVINFQYSNGRKYDYFTQWDSTEKLFSLDENLFRIGLTLPFDFSRNVYTTTLSLDGGYSYSLIDFNKSVPDWMIDRSWASGPDFTLLFSNTKFQSKRQYYPRWGQVISATYHNLNLNTDQGNLRCFSLNSQFYFPGISTNHSLSMAFGYENNTYTQSYGAYWLSKKLEFIRGYVSEPYTEFIKATAIYSMPLFYPDFSIGRVFYCNRIRGNLFYDYGETNIDKYTFTDYQSVGFDLNAEVYIFSLPIPIQMGIRFSHLLTDNSNTMQFLFLEVAL